MFRSALYRERVTRNPGGDRHLSLFHLLRTFRKQVSLPPHEYLIQVWFRQAKILLTQEYSINEVADVTGLADQSHLTRQFKRNFGAISRESGSKLKYKLHHLLVL
jgi:AraC-like DNA-binding protein